MWKLRTAFSAGVVTPVWLLLVALVAICCVLSSERVLADSDQVSDDYVYDADRHAQTLKKRVAELHKEYAEAKSKEWTDHQIEQIKMRLDIKKAALKPKFQAVLVDEGQVSELAQTCLGCWDTDLAKCTEETKSLLSTVLKNESKKRVMETKLLNNLVKDLESIHDIEKRLMQYRDAQENKERELMNALWLLERIQRELK